MSNSYFKTVSNYLSSYFYLTAEDGKREQSKEEEAEKQATDKAGKVKEIKLQSKNNNKKEKSKKRIAKIKEVDLGDGDSVDVERDNSSDLGNSRALRLTKDEENELFFESGGSIPEGKEKGLTDGEDGDMVGLDLFKKMEQIKQEVGENWLKVYNESLGSVKRAGGKKKEERKKVDLTKFNFQYLNPNGEEEGSLNENKEDITRQGPVDKEENIDKLDKNSAEEEKVDQETIPEEKVEDQLEEENKLPEGASFDIEMNMIDLTRIESKHPEYHQKHESKWIFSEEILYIFDLNDEIIEQIQYFDISKLLKLNYKEHGLRLEVRKEANVWPLLLDIICFNETKYKKIISLLKKEVKKNQEMVSKLYKQGKCLKCDWIGYLSDITTQLEIDTQFIDDLKLPYAKLEVQKEIHCLKCNSNLLIEFYGDLPEEHRNEGGIMPAIKASSQMITSITNLANPKFYYDNLFNKGKEVEGEENEEEDKVEINEISKLPSYNNNNIPFQQLNNQLKLHFDLNVLTNENELPLSWLPATYLIQPSPFLNNNSGWNILGNHNNNNNLDKERKEENFIYLLLSNYNLYLFTINNNYTTDNLENYLQIIYTIPFDKIQHIDIGCNRQSLSIHLNTYEMNKYNKKLYDKFKTEVLPSNSITVMIRDKLKCTQLLDELLTQFYELERKKVINQDILWGIYNLRKSVFIKRKENEMKTINQQKFYLKNSEIYDEASGENIILDKVNFEFLKFVGAIYVFDKNNNSKENHMKLLPITLINTPQFIYLCNERNDIWPPPLKELLQLNELNEQANEKEREETKKLIKCFNIEQYQLMECIKVDTILDISLEEIKFSCHLKEDNSIPNVNISCKITIKAERLKIDREPIDVPLPESDDEEINEELKWELFFNSKNDGMEFLNGVNMLLTCN
ncbi:hypothetical protein K502DRAFT_339916 [Neoconidiobolus thromboides FSU 785]|nr:hypothetical protein K502DRAFT_339916 [Neoconidiobolus thromboides FSU 785]